MKTEGLPTVGATDLEARIDESIRQSNLREYYPTVFERMRAAYRTIGAVERLVTTNPNDPQSGFNRLHRLGILEWSLEVAVRKFPHLFTKKARNCAEFRLTVMANDIF